MILLGMGKLMTGYTSIESCDKGVHRKERRNNVE